jgi:pimeloyl-ACP methyl ester carboxylesterase
MKDQVATVGDLRVAYTDSGGDGAPVVFVHGLAEDRRSWAPQLGLPSLGRTVGYDLRGHGATSLGAAEGTLAQLGQDLIGVLETVTGPARCVGFSLGGTIVLWAAAARPDLIPHAVVLGTSSVVGRSAAEFYRGRIGLVESGDRDAFARALRDDTAAAIANPAVDVDDVTARRLAAVGEGGGYINAAQAMALVHGQPLTPTLADVKTHVDVVGGENDTFCPRRAADIIVEALPDCTYHELARVGHLMNVDDPAAVTTLLQQLLERTATS